MGFVNPKLTRAGWQWETRDSTERRAAYWAAQSVTACHRLRDTSLQQHHWMGQIIILTWPIVFYVLMLWQNISWSFHANKAFELNWERLWLTVCCWVCTFRWQVLRWCWAVTVAAVYLWAGERRVEMQPLPMKPCRLAGHHVDGGGALRHVKSWTGTA